MAEYIKIYPEKDPVEQKEDYIDEALVSANIIDMCENGAPEGYKINGVDMSGKPLSRQHILSIALNGKNAPETAKRIWNDIMDERDKLNEVNILDAKTEDEYKIEIEKICKYVDKDVWYNKILQKYDASSFDDLKVKVEPIEIKKV